jgi:hypothetical protein
MYPHVSDIHGTKQGRDISRERNSCHLLSSECGAIVAPSQKQLISLRKNLLSLATTRTRHVGDDPNIELYDPDLWTDEFAFLNSQGQAQIQTDLFYD